MVRQIVRVCLFFFRVNFFNKIYSHFVRIVKFSNTVSFYFCIKWSIFMIMSFNDILYIKNLAINVSSEVI